MRMFVCCSEFCLKVSDPLRGADVMECDTCRGCLVECESETSVVFNVLWANTTLVLFLKKEKPRRTPCPKTKLERQDKKFLQIVVHNIVGFVVINTTPTILSTQAPHNYKFFVQSI